MTKIKRSTVLLLSILILSISTIFLLFATLEKYSQLTFMHVYNICHQAVTSWISTGMHFLGFGVSMGIVLFTMLLLLRVLFSFIKTQKKLTVLIKNRLTNEPQKLKNVRNKIKLPFDKIIVILSTREIVFTGGLIYPQIFISEYLIDTLSDKELEAVLIHEKYHLENRHSLWLFIADIIFSTVVFIPLFKSLFYSLKVQFEKEADNAVIDTQKSVKHLQSALVAIMGESLPSFHPGFYSRRMYKISISHIAVSALSIGVLIALLFIPYEAQAVSLETVGTCNQNQCSVNCLPETRSITFQKSAISSQDSLFSSAHK